MLSNKKLFWTGVIPLNLSDLNEVKMGRKPALITHR